MSNTIFYKIGSSAPEKNIPPDPCTNLKAIAKGNNVELTWNDPSKITESEDGIVAVWSYSVLVRKDNGYPSTPEDGVEVCRSSVLNQYQVEPYLDPITTRDTTYYYSIFAVSSMDETSGPVSTSVYVPNYRIMTVKINEASSNPANCSYADDAVEMSSGKNATEWTDFFGYRPCLFKNGQVVGYLNPNDYSKFEDGTEADITSGDAGDVMVEFPRRGVKISKAGNTVTVSMTDNPDDPEFTYYAHTRGDARKDYFYLGAYLGYVNDDKLGSLSDKDATNYLIRRTARTNAHANGTGYEIFTYYQFLFLQVMYLLQYKNRNSQTSVGYGNTYGGTRPHTGGTDTKGMIYGDGTNTALSIKLFGIEDLWGGLLQVIDGIGSDESYDVYTATDAFEIFDSYTNVGSRFCYGSENGYIVHVSGTSELGLIATGMEGFYQGSQTTYYCDYASQSQLSDFSLISVCIGGYWRAASLYMNAGIFFYRFEYDSSDSSLIGSRLSYY